MRTIFVAAAFGVLLSCGCRGSDDPTRALQSCVAKRLPGGAVTRTVATTVEGVTSVTYAQAGGETDLTIFPTAARAAATQAAEARIGDAHDRRAGRVLYTGGIGVRQAILACLRG